jgi:Pyridoxamine 5'-phosphate oxidase
MNRAPASRLSSMSPRAPIRTVNLATSYDEPEMPWSRAVEALGEGSFGPDTAVFLGTVGADGRPHSAGVGVAVLDAVPYFTSGTKAHKTHNLQANPRVSLSMRLEGIDLVLEGIAVRVTDRDTLDTIAQLYAAGGWPATPTTAPDEPALTAPYSAQSAGPGPWHLYRLDVDKAIGVGLRAPHGASRWVFSTS